MSENGKKKQGKASPGKGRRGKAVKSKDGKGEFAPGSAAGPAVFDAEQMADGKVAGRPGPRIFWESGDGDSFLVENSHGANGSTVRAWDRWPKDALKSLLRDRYCIALKVREGEFVSEMEALLLYLRRERVVDFSTSMIAGYGSGLYENFGHRILVRRESRPVTPKAGNCEDVRRFIDSRLNLIISGGDSLGPQQAVYFHGWAKASLEARLNGSPGNWRPGQGVIFAGPSDCGKSRLQHNIITPLLGGRSANPGPYLFGATDFNAEIIAAEHLLMEDPASGTRDFSRVYFGEMWKQLIVADTFRLHRKREDAVTVAPFFRSTISVNNDPDKMRVLPLLTPDMREKVMLFLVSDEPIPFPLETMQERLAFVRLMQEQMPAYAWWLLNEFKPAENIFHKRYGVKQWLHPDLARELFEDTPQSQLLAIIDAARWGHPVPVALWEMQSESSLEGAWDGGYLELEKLLLDSNFKEETERLLKRHRIERLMSRLKEDEPARVIQHRTGQQRRWLIMPPNDA